MNITTVDCAEFAEMRNAWEPDLKREGERNQWFCFRDVMFETPTRYPGDKGYMRGYTSLEFKGEIKVGEIRVIAFYRMYNNTRYLKPWN